MTDLALKFFEDTRRNAEKEKAMKIAKKLYKKNLSVDEISDITGLTKTEIENYAKEQ